MEHLPEKDIKMHIRVKFFTYIFVGLLPLFYGCTVMGADRIETHKAPIVDHAHDTHLQKLMYAINDMDTEEVKRTLQGLSDDEKNGLLNRKIPIRLVVGIGEGSMVLNLYKTPLEHIAAAKVCGIVFWSSRLEEIERFVQKADSTRNLN
jgi:hypothetical protein